MFVSLEFGFMQASLIFGLVVAGFYLYFVSGQDTNFIDFVASIVKYYESVKCFSTQRPLKYCSTLQMQANFL